MLEPLFEWIINDSLNPDGTENNAINTNVTHILRFCNG